MRWLLSALLMVALASPASAAAFTITEFEAQAGSPAGAHAPRYIQPGPDGALWITDLARGRIMRMRTDGVVTDDLVSPTLGAYIVGIAAGPDGAMWFTESSSGRIGRIGGLASTTAGPAIPSPSAGAGPATPGVAPGAVPVDRMAPGAPAADLTAPRVLSGPAVAPARITLQGDGALTFGLSEPGRVQVRIEREAAGRSSSAGCVRLTRRARSRPPCTRYVTVRTLSSAGAQGANAITISGRTLLPGRHRVVMTITDAAGNVSTNLRARFAVVLR